jgi:hypothetical protein
MSDYTHYKFKVKAPFTAANVNFVPGREYTVTAEIFNGPTSDGKSFASLCTDVRPFNET